MTTFLNKLKIGLERVKQQSDNARLEKEQKMLDSRDKDAMKIVRNKFTEVPVKSVPLEIKVIRTEICKSCEFMELETCNRCKCPIDLITSFPPFICPLHKWGWSQ